MPDKLVIINSSFYYSEEEKKQNSLEEKGYSFREVTELDALYQEGYKISQVTPVVPNNGQTTLANMQVVIHLRKA